MRDAQWIFGAIALATKDTDASSADVVKLGAINSKAPFSLHQTGRAQDGYEVVFCPAAALKSIDSFIPFIEDSDDNSTFAKILTGPQTSAGLGAGTHIKLPLPMEHKQYIRVGCTPKSSGTFTATTVNAWVEAGPN